MVILRRQYDEKYIKEINYNDNIWLSNIVIRLSNIVIKTVWCNEVKKIDLVGVLKQSMNLSSLALWSVFTTKLVSIGDVRLPNVLQTLDFMPVNAIINVVNQAHDLLIKQRYNYAAFIATVAIMVIIVARLSIYLYCRSRKQKVYKGLQGWFKFKVSLWRRVWN